MKIRVTNDEPSAETTLVDPADFQAFSVEIVGEASVATDGALDALGRVDDDDHVWVDQAALLRLAGSHADDPAWRDRLTGMIGYARSRDWVDDSGAIRAHVEHTLR